MSEVFFIGDTHFGHKNIITFSREKFFGPLTTIEEHDEELVRRWNSVVMPNDKVFHLGDFCFGKRHLEIAGRLNGRKALVMGNHDLYAIEDYLKYFTKLSGAIQFDSMILTHIPIHPSELNRFTVNVHGHLHIKTIDDPRYVNVCAEQINLTPISYGVILKKLEKENES